MDYTELREHLKAGDFRKADDETRALLIRLAGEGAVKRGWVYFTEVRAWGAWGRPAASWLCAACTCAAVQASCEQAVFFVFHRGCSQHACCCDVQDAWLPASMQAACGMQAQWRGPPEHARTPLCFLILQVKSISVKDFTTMDTLWKVASNGKFGYSVQVRRSWGAHSVLRCT